MKRTITEVIAGDTRKITWVSSGVTPSSIHAALHTGSDTLVASLSMTSSGNGYFYGLITFPTSLGYYMAESQAMVNSYPNIRQKFVKVVKHDTD